MPTSKRRHIRNVVISAIGGIVLAGGVFACAAIHYFLDGHPHRNWQAVLFLDTEFAAIMGLGWFILVFLYRFLTTSHQDGLEDALLDESPPIEELEIPMTGFVTMEYYNLIWNRTFVVFIANEGLYGWKALGATTGKDKLYFQPFEALVHEEEFMRDRIRIQKLAALRGGFFIPRDTISNVEVSDKKKWGMSGIPHSGRIRITQQDGSWRELILLGSADPAAIKNAVLLTPTADRPTSRI